MNRPLLTTGRTSTRMDEQARTRLTQRLAPFTLTPQHLAHPPAPLEVELGMGNGLAMLERARANPSWNFLGAEVYLNGLRSLASAWHKAPVQNLLATSMDGRELLKALPQNSLNRLLILFPDPWPKAKHHKRRLVSSELLDAAARTMPKGAELWVVTDWPSYAFHAIATLHAHKSFALAGTENAAADCKPSARLEDKLGPHHLQTPPAWWVKTKYQQKADTAGRETWYLLARRT